MHSIKNQLNKLNKIEPNTEWKNKQWDLLLNKIDTKETRVFNSWERIGFVFQHPSLLRPIMNLSIILVVFVIGSWTALATVTNSMPGNLFYPTKVALEKVEVALTVNGNAKVTKQTDIARRRVGELQYIVAVNKQPINKIHVDKTVKNINENLQGAHDDLNRLSQAGGNGEFTKTAEEVEESVNKISQSLQETSQKLPADVQVSVNEQIQETVDKVDDISAQAFELVIKQWLADDQVHEEQVLEKINEKIISLQSKLAELHLVSWVELQTENEDKEELILKAEELDKAVIGSLDQIDIDLSEKNYLGVLPIINKIRQNISDLEKIVNNEYVIEEVLGEEEVVVEDTETVDEITTTTKDVIEEPEVKIEVIK